MLVFCEFGAGLGRVKESQASVANNKAKSGENHQTHSKQPTLNPTLNQAIKAGRQAPDHIYIYIYM